MSSIATTSATGYITLDTETTGLDPAQGHRIIEVAIAAWSNAGRLSAAHVWRCNPGRSSDPGALAVHGIADEELRDLPTPEEVVANVRALTDGADVVIHNAAFDLAFLDAATPPGGAPWSHGPRNIICTRALARQRVRLPAGQRHNLDNLADHLGVDRSGRARHHSALADALILGHVYHRLRALPVTAHLEAAA